MMDRVRGALRLCERARWLLVASVIASILVSTRGPAFEPAYAAAEDSEEAIAFYEEALDLYNEGEFVAAIIQLKNVLQRDPRHLAARILIGQSYLMLGDGVSAEAELAKARELGADEALVLVPLGEALFLQRRFVDLLKTVRNGGFSQDTEAEILVLRGKAYAELRKLEEAEKAFQAAAGLAPNNPGPLLGLARVELNRGDRNRAAYLINEALKIAPGEIDGLFMQGELARLNRDLEAAIEAYGKVIAIQPGHLPARTARAAALIDLGRHAQARPDIEEIRSRDPQDPHAAYLESVILAAEGDIKGAKEALTDAGLIIRNYDPAFIKSHPPTLLTASLIAFAQGAFDDARIYASEYVAKDPAHVGARRLLATLQLRNNQPEAAVATLTPAAELADKDPEILGLLGSAMLRSGRLDDARRVLDRAVGLAPDTAWIRAQRARSLLDAGEGRAAAEDLEAALAVNPEQIELAQLLAVVYLDIGDFNAALASARDLVKRDPDNPEHLDVLGAAHMGLGQLQPARTAFERALAADPDYLNARANLAQVEQMEGNLDVARQHYTAMLENTAAGTMPLAALSRIAEREGDLDAAIQWLEKLRSIDGEDVDAQIRLVDLYIASGEPDEALFVARKLRTSNATTLPILETLGRAQLAAGKNDEAAETFASMVHGARYSAPTLYRIAQYQRQANDPDNAYRTLEKALLSRQDYRPVIDALVQHDARAGRFEVARDRIRQYRVVSPDAPFADRLEGDVLMREGRYTEAVAAYEAAFESGPNRETLLRLYMGYRADGEPERMLPVFENWLKRFPDDMAIRRTYASALMEVGRYEEAIAAHEALNEQRPDDPVILNNLAWLYFETEDPRALEFARRAHALAPDQAPTIDTLGWILVNQDQAKEGLSLLREAFSRDSKSPRIRYHLAVALDQVGRTDEAKRELKALLDADPDAETASAARALLTRLGG